METATTQKHGHKIVDKVKEIAHEKREQAERLSEKTDSLIAPVYVGLTLGSIIYSLVLFFRRSKENATYVGLWAPTFLALGLLHRLERICRREVESG